MLLGRTSCPAAAPESGAAKRDDRPPKNSRARRGSSFSVREPIGPRCGPYAKMRVWMDARRSENASAKAAPTEYVRCYFNGRQICARIPVLCIHSAHRWGHVRARLIAFPQTKSVPAAGINVQIGFHAVALQSEIIIDGIFAPAPIVIGHRDKRRGRLLAHANLRRKRAGRRSGRSFLGLFDHAAGIDNDRKVGAATHFVRLVNRLICTLVKIG